VLFTEPYHFQYGPDLLDVSLISGRLLLDSPCLEDEQWTVHPIQVVSGTLSCWAKLTEILIRL
jgi:hypothetical protein